MITNLVIGSEGFVGKPFCDYLEHLGEKVVRFDIKRSDREDARHVSLNLHNINRVYFLAWDEDDLEDVDAQIAQLESNLQLLLNIMPQLKESNIPFLFASSKLAEEYNSIFGVAKRLGEMWTELIGGVKLRLWNVYGTNEGRSERSHVVSDFVNMAVKTGKIKMMTTGEEMRQFIYIEDACKALHHAMSNRYTNVYDVTSFEWIKVIDVAQVIADLTGAKVQMGSKLGHTFLTPAMAKMPGWEPEISMREGLSKMINRLKEDLEKQNS